MATISVIVPVYKVEAYLRRCVDSILGQTYSDFELILVDDGSPDNCPAICDEYTGKDPRIKVIHQQNGGLSAARNAGIDWVFQNSDSEWFSFIDSDDYVHPRYLEVLLNAAETTNTSVAIGSYIEFSKDDVIPEESIAEPQKWTSEDFFVEKNVNAIIACGKLYRRKCFEEIRYPLGKLHEDEFTTYKILFRYNEVSFVETPLYFYFQNSNGITKRAWTPRRMDGIEALEEQLLFFKQKKLMKAYGRVQWNILTKIVMQLRDMKRMYPEQKKALRKMARERYHEFNRETGLSLWYNLSIFRMIYPELIPYIWLKSTYRKYITIFKEILSQK